MKLLRHFLLLLAAAVAAPAAAQSFPALSGRVVDAANLLSPAQEAELTGKLEALERASSRQLVVATIPDLEGLDDADYGYRLGRHWGIGQSQANNGTILLVAPNERKVRVEVGYGLEPILTDALSHQIIQTEILPRFRQNDMAGGIMAGADAVIAQLGAPPEQAEQRALAAAQAQRQQSSGGEGESSIFGLVFWMFILFFVIIPMLRGGRRGRRYGRRRRGAWGAPVVIWGGGSGGGWGSSGGGWGGGGGGGGFGGFSGGGGSFGGGGASGSW
jgi:uncharacterized protein